MHTNARSWLPVEIAFDPCPALIPEASVRWMEFGKTALAEPFFQHTVTRLKASAPPPREIDTDLDAVVIEGERRGRSAPAGFIFHVSRCGSSLVANGLRLARGIQVLAEARPMTSLFLPYAATGSDYAERHWIVHRSRLAHALASLFSHYRRGSSEAIVVKWTSVNSVMVSEIRAVWPDTPCVFVVRNPLEVLVANLQPGGLIETRRSVFAAHLMGSPASHRFANMRDEEYGARVIGHYMTMAIVADDRNRLIDYDDINPRTLGIIAKHFGLTVPRTESSWRPVFERHAKDPLGKRRFRDDRQRKLRKASKSAREAIERWAFPVYESLLGRSNRIR